MIYIDSPSDVENAISELYRERPLMFGVDTETTGLDPNSDKILLIQIGNTRKQFVFDVARCGTSIYKVIEFLKDKEVVKIFHNAKFDYAFFKTNFKIDIHNIKCTFIAEQLLTRGKNVKLSLKHVLNKYLRVQLPKTEGASFADMEFGDEFTEEQLEYAGEDVKYCVPLYREMFKLVRERGMEQLAQIEFECVRCSGDMEVYGVSIDREHWLSLRDDAQERLLAAKEKLDEVFDGYTGEDLFGLPDINYNSPAQVKPLLEKIIGEKLENTAARTLERLSATHDVAEYLLKFREAAKKISTYGEKFLENNIHPVTGKIHSNFNQIGTDTGRYSSSSVNLQNIPKEKIYRHAFVASSPNYKMITADFASQELKLLAYISKDPTLLEAAREGRDLHCTAASILYDIPYEDFFDEFGDRIEEMEKKYRTPAKAINFGLIYGMGVMKLADSLEIEIGEAKQLMNTYFAKFPSVKDKLKEFENYVVRTRMAKSPLDGRIMDLSAIDWDHGGHVAHAKNQAKNFPFQGAGATTTKFALCRIKRQIENNDYNAKIVLTVHDEIVVEAHINEAEEVAKMVEVEMEKAFNFFAPGIEMKVDAEILDTWTK